MPLDPSVNRTGAAVPSDKPLDIQDDSLVFDTMINDTSGQTVLDRKGVERETYQSAINRINNDANEVIDSYRQRWIGDYTLPNKVFRGKGDFVTWAIGDGGDGNAYVYIGPESGLPYFTDVDLYPDPNSDPNLQFNPTVTAIYVNQVGAGNLSQGLGGNVWPIEYDQSAQIGDDLTGYKFVRLQGGSFLNIYAFNLVKKDASGDLPSGSLDSFNISTASYDCVINGDEFWLWPTKSYETGDSIKVDWFWPNKDWDGASGTDDTFATKNAINFAVSAAGTNPENKFGYIKPIEFTSGSRYLLTQEDALIPDVLAPFSNYAGITFKCNGIQSCEIVFDYDSSTLGGYLLDNDNVFGNSEFENLSFFSPNNNSYFMRLSGAVNNISFTNCRWWNFRRMILAEGNALTSELSFYNCSSRTTPGSVVFWLDNPQSVNHWFYSSQFSGGGSIFKVDGGGSIKSFGGTFTLFNQGIMVDYNGDGSTIGPSNSPLVFIGAKPELIDNSAQLLNMDAPSGMVVFEDLNTTTDSGGATVPRVSITDANSVKFVRSNIGVNTTMEVTGGVYLEFNDCDLGQQIHKQLTLSRDTSGNQLFPKVRVIDGNLLSKSIFNEAVDVDMYIDNTFSTKSPTVKSYPFKAGSSLEADAGIAYGFNTFRSESVFLPLGATIVDVLVVDRGRPEYPGNTTTIRVVTENGDTLLPDNSYTSSDATTSKAEDIYYRCDTDDEREVKIEVQIDRASGLPVTDGYLLIRYI